MFESDRPIKPDPKYLEQAQQKYQQQLKASKTAYLKKQSATVLPCQKHTQKPTSASQQRHKKSKAEIYEQIKNKNRSRFGEWKKNNQQQHQQMPKKTIHPKKMTVSYHPKEIIIDTEEYKKQGNGQKKQILKKEDPEKMEYEKMIDYLKKCYTNFEEDKQKFQKQKQYLRFKKIIESEEGLPTIESKVDHIRAPPGKIIVVQNGQNGREQKKIKDNIDNNDENIDKTNIQPLKYGIDRLHQCHPFTLKQIYKYIEWDHLYYDGNPYYQEAMYMLQNQRHQAVSKNIGQDQKRISKFPENWFEVWVPGQYRVAYNQTKAYKVVWHSNGDIKQEFSGIVGIYFSKKTKVLEIKVKEKEPIWFFSEIKQLQMKGKNGKEVIFSDGRHQWVEDEKK